MTAADFAADIFFATVDYPEPDWKRTKWRWSPMEAKLYAHHRANRRRLEQEWMER